MGVVSKMLSLEEIHEAMKDKTPDEIAYDFVELSPVMSAMTAEQKKAVTACIKQALALGNIMATSPGQSRLEQEIAQEAVEFEKTLDPSIVPYRMRSGAYAWNWCYRDPALQKQFKEFCISKSKKND